MAYLVDHEIRALCGEDQESRLIAPFVSKKTSFGGATYGLSSCGYDLRLGHEFIQYGSQQDVGGYEDKLGPLTAQDHPTVFKINAEGCPSVTLHPGMSVLAHTLEVVSMPPNLVGFIKDKSTWARLFIDAKNTVIEPGWSGQITLELTNHNPNSIELPLGVGIVQIMFSRLSSLPEKDYGAGKYQSQRGAQPPKG